MRISIAVRKPISKRRARSGVNTHLRPSPTSTNSRKSGARETKSFAQSDATKAASGFGEPGGSPAGLRRHRQVDRGAARALNGPGTGLATVKAASVDAQLGSGLPHHQSRRQVVLFPSPPAGEGGSHRQMRDG